ncbi:hypothetical protein [Natrinema saccharevitans]|nr:hypothetical protein [Natrinema saccharevitans]
MGSGFDIEATNEALREQLSDCQETLERREQSSNPEMDETGCW